MMRLLYNLLFPIVLAGLLPRYVWRMWRRGNFRRDFGQRFARYSSGLRAEFSCGTWIWVHAVSVGELLVALKILRELHRRQPGWRFVVSSTTSTAHSIALARREAWWRPVYTPLDFLPVVRRAFDIVRPRAVVLIESEMWPNFVWEAVRRNRPVLLANARVSPRSERRYRRFAPYLRPVTGLLSGVGLQENAHAALWKLLGVPESRLHFTGSVKFDAVGDPHVPRDFRPVLRAHGIDDADPILLGGSTHDGEEEILAEALRILRASHPTLRLLVAPRHVERSRGIYERLSALGLRAAFRSASPEGSSPDVLLIDTTGELRDWYYCADVVFIGKSLVGVGGQNPAEAVMAGRPVIFGPHMENFATLRDALIEGRGSVEVSDARSLAAATDALLADSSRREDCVHRAADALKPHQNAAARTAEMIERAIIGSDSAAASV